ncbi:MAG TPA: FMN-binding negative transcriptional regulator [Propionibacteriaceae bacterium]|jgi:transcriptional regulator|nr:FMN-binding negative transcriptional regulator [Propionibacteriaceae bacterium]
MYIPAHFAASPDDVRALLTSHTAADLVTSTGTGLLASTLPLIFDPDAGEHGALRGHLARNNPQWSTPARGESLVILRGSDAYITPTWYAAKARHGRVVPTWNYTVAHVYGNLVIHDDPDWLDAHVRRLTEQHEAAEPHPWSVDDAPDRYIRGQLRAIVGLELVITRVEAKLKLSQNRGDDDVEGVVAGLHRRGDHRSADAVAAARRDRKS